VAVAVSKLRAGNEDYHLRAIGGAEDYALGVSEAPGRWLGGGCASLGLSGTVDPDDFRRLLVGCDPATGEPLSKMRTRTAGFDITFSPPKSVSVLFGCGGGDVTKAVVEAHEAAVAAAVAYMEPHCSRVRVTVTDDTGQHQEFRPADGHVAAAFTHRTSRAGDPQLHEHLVVMNAARGTEDGRWRALGHHPDLFAHAKTADAIYLAELRHQLTARLAVGWEERDGHMEIAGVDPGLCDLFSKRTHAALDHLAKRAQPVTPRSMHTAIIDTRRAKPAHGDDPGRGKVSWSPNAGDFGVEPSDTAGLHGRWRSEMAAAGFDLDLTEVVLRAEPPKLDPQQVAALGARLAGPEGLTATDVWFDRRAVLRAFCTLPGVSAADASRLADDWLTSADVVSLGARSQGAAEAFTTRDLLSQEESLLHSAEERCNAGVGVVDKDAVDAVVDGRELSDEQEQMVRSLTSSGAGVECVVGRAGTGKTFALDAAQEAWAAAGHTVLGTATSAAAAGQLRRGARMEATTVARMLLDAHRDGLPAGCVLIVDEAAMTDTRSLASLCRAVEAARGKLVMVGDHRQLGAVAAGGAFAHLVGRIGAVELTEVRRQESVEDREDLAEIRSGDVAAGIRGLMSRVGRTTVCDTPESQRDAMAADWCAARSAGHSVLLLGRRRKNVEAMSVAVREARRAAGELGDEELTVPITVPGGAGVDRRWQPPERTFSTGDEVLFTANTTGRWRYLKEQLPGVHNGAGGTVTAINAGAGTVTVKLDTSPDEAQQWEALAAKRDAEVVTLQTQMGVWAQRRRSAGTPAERATADRRRQATATKLHNRLTDRSNGVVAVPGRGKLPRPGHTVEVPPAYLQAGNLALSYARTIHTAQGATADVVLVDGDDLAGREAAYVAMSRHRVDVRTYLTSAAPGAVEAETVGRSTLVDRLVERVSHSESERTATEMLARRRAQKELAAKPLGELSSEVAQLEAELVVAARRGAMARTSEDPVAAARAELATAEARAAQSPGERAAHQVWLARSRLAQAEQRAARRTTPSPDRAVNTDMTARVARLQDLRAALELQSRLAVEALAAEGGGGLGPRPARGPERAAWEQQAAATLTYVARWGVQPTAELGRDVSAEQRRESERLAEMLNRRTTQQRTERERGVSA